MTEEDAYRNSGFRKYKDFSGIFYAGMVLCFIFSLHWNEVLAQDETDFEEISVFLYIRQIGSTEMPAYIHGEVLYLPVTDVFAFLKINNTPTPGFDTVAGFFFINQQSSFLIDRVNNKIIYQNNIYNLNQGDLIRTENNLYLKSNYFSEIFGLDCSFSFTSMSVTITTKLELPMIKEMRQAMMRANLSRLKGDIQPDTVIKRNYPLFHFGAADWSLAANEQIFGKTDVRLNLSLGGILFGGEATANLNFSNAQVFDSRQQNYIWHFANNDFKIVKQIIVGKIPTQSLMTIPAPVVGIQFSNTPTTFQRSFCTYTLSDYTSPGWIVELYVNYVLVDYVKADASGYFSFAVPLVYGNSLVKLRFYGPWGEEHTREQTIRIPYNFLPPRKFEYTFNAGIVENAKSNIYSKLNMNYGINRRLTVGLGAEYLSGTPKVSALPFVNFSLRLATSLLITGEYTLGTRFKGVLTYRFPANLLIELYYSNLNKNQKSLTVNYLEERKAVISMPFHTRFFSSTARLSVTQIVLPGSNYFSAELLISGAVLGVSTNLTTSALFLDPANPYIFSILSLGFKLPAKIIFTPQIMFTLSQGKILSVKLAAEKKIFHNGNINLVFEKNFMNNGSTIQAGVRYDFSFLQTNVNMRYANNVSTLMQFVRGSLVYEGKGGGVKFSKYAVVGKGGIVVMPFLDMNCNGVFDKGEQKVVGIDLRISGGRIEKNYRDSTIHISELEPFTTYYLELQNTGFENVSWNIPKPIISITVNSNQYRIVQVPINVLGEVSGMIQHEVDGLKKGFSRMIISFYRNDSSFVAKTISEEDGYFTFLGLKPGKYYAKIDASQMRTVEMEVSPSVIPFEIQKSKEGDQVTGLEFNLRPAIHPAVGGK